MHVLVPFWQLPVNKYPSTQNLCTCCSLWDRCDRFNLCTLTEKVRKGRGMCRVGGLFMFRSKFACSINFGLEISRLELV